jgi:VIT1/CCC1 family predicted Fe2+/Mn2+ transporter
MMSEQSAQHEANPNPRDASSGRLQVLATEHWSLLATRSLTYLESFSRVSMFLSVLTGAVVALALFAQVDHFHATFLFAAILILSVVAFVGIVTIGRLGALNRENFWLVKAMNQLRHGYLEMYPELEPYFSAGSHDDFRGVMLTMNLPLGRQLSPLASVAQGFQSLPAMVSMVVAVVVGLLAALIAVALGAPTIVAASLAAFIFLLTNVMIAVVAERAFFKFARETPSRFPSPPESRAAR